MHHPFLCLFALGLAATATAQEIPGLKVTLQSRTLVASHQDVELKLVLQATKDLEVPADLMSGARLSVKCDDQPGKPIVQAGKGGPVALVAGTRIERTLTFPAMTFLTRPDGDAVTRVLVSWDGLAGVGCDFKVAPDTSKVQLENLDLAKTQIVLVTNMGEMTVSLRPDKAPKHTENFVKLCLQGFYDGTKFHRVIKNFMIQGGCPNTKDDSKPETWGSGGPGYSLNAEFNDLRHLRGTLSAARTSDPNSAGSGFFIVHKDAPHLDNQYSAFGNLEAGADTLDRIANTTVGGSGNSTPLQPVVLQGAIVLPVKKK